MKTKAIYSIGAAIVMSALVAGAATAAQVKAASGPQPGDCKRAFETISGPSAPVAKAMWVQLVSSKYGTKWAQWVGAKDKAITPNGSQFMARGKPCFYHPEQ